VNREGLNDNLAHRLACIFVAPDDNRSHADRKFQIQRSSGKRELRRVQGELIAANPDHQPSARGWRR
jgi:hypothetical protein